MFLTDTLTKTTMCQQFLQCFVGMPSSATVIVGRGGKRQGYFRSQVEAARRLAIDPNLISRCVRGGDALPDGRLVRRATAPDEVAIRHLQGLGPHDPIREFLEAVGPRRVSSNQEDGCVW